MGFQKLEALMMKSTADRLGRVPSCGLVMLAEPTGHAMCFYSLDRVCWRAVRGNGLGGLTTKDVSVGSSVVVYSARNELGTTTQES